MFGEFASIQPRERQRGTPSALHFLSGPDLMVPKVMGFVELSLTQEKLVLNMSKVSGSIWVLDNVGP
jgi:hypothetical protein